MAIDGFYQSETETTASDAQDSAGGMVTNERSCAKLTHAH